MIGPEAVSCVVRHALPPPCRRNCRNRPGGHSPLRPASLPVSVLVLFSLLLCPPWLGAAEKPKSQNFSPAAVPKESPSLGKGNLYALVVGVSKYRDKKIPKLDLADQDATAFGDFLKSQNKVFKEALVTYLLNDKATKLGIEKYLYYSLPKAGKDDTIILFFSGHGAEDPMRPQEFLFVPYDAETEYLGATSVKMTGLDFLKGINVEKVLIIADACRSGGFSLGKSKDLSPSLELFVRQARNSSGTAIITSASDSQLSWEVPNRKNSVFTYHLLEGLKGKADRDHDGIVNLNEAYEYAYQRTKDETGGRQHPKLGTQIIGEFPLSLVGPRTTESELRLRLVLAAAAGDQAQVERSLTYGAEVDSRGEDNDTSLIVASRKGYVGIVRLLLSRGADADATNHARSTALHAAAEKGHMEVVKQLLGVAANVGLKDTGGRTALALAALNGHTKVALLLLDEGSDVKARTEQGYTPLSLAAAGGRLDVVKLLLAWDAEVSTKDLDGWTPLTHACRQGHPEIVKLLLEKGATVKAKTGGPLGQDLLVATMKGDAEAVRTLIGDGARLDSETETGGSSLSLASSLGHAEVVKVLLAAGAGVQAKSESDEVPLIGAATAGRGAAVKMLLDAGAAIEATDKEGSTPLMVAARNGHTDAVKVLLARNANLNARNPKGATPLIAAARNGQVGVAKALLARGAEIDAADQDGNTALIIAALKGQTEMVKLLTESGAQVNGKNSQGSTPLILAARGGHVEAVRILLYKGADIGLQDWEGKTALAVASERNRGDVMKVLKGP